MKARSFIVLAVVTAIAVVAAAVVQPPSPIAVAGAGEKVFPDLPARIDSAAAIVIRGPEGTVTLERGDAGWTIRERGGYPASIDKLRGAVMALMDLERAEPKTARPEGYAQLDLGDPGETGAKGREMTIADAAGKPIAAIILGRTVHSLGGETSQFIRVPGEERAWLVRGHVDAGVEPRDWIDRRLLALSAGEVKRLHVVRPDGSTLTLVRDAPNSTLISLEEVAKGKRLKRPEALPSMIGSLTPLDADDVRPAADVPRSARSGRIEVVPFSGDAVSFTLLDKDGDLWLLAGTPVRPQAHPVAGDWAFKVPNWKIEPLLRPIPDLLEADPG